MAFNYTYYQSKLKKGTGPSKSGVYDHENNMFSPGAALFSFTSFTFTNGTTTGVFGPTQANLLAAYDTVTYPWLNDTNLFAQGEYQGFQKFTIPKTGTYRFTVKGAGGGQKSHPSYQSGTYRPRGSQIVADFSLNIGEKIQILVGQRGEDDNTYYATQNSSSEGDNAGPGGGGGSFVFFDKDDTYPILVAGGGAGGTRNTYTNAEGSTGSNANTSQTTTTTSTGTNGNGGPGFTGGSSYWCGSGAGWLTNGTGGNQSTSYNYLPGTQGGQGGRAPRNGGFGGEKGSDGTNSGGDGGFGGGGGGYSDNTGTGGGGGYSGGTGGNSSPTNAAGGGGGLYAYAGTLTSAGIGTATWIQTVSTTVASTWDHGSVTIQLL